MTMATRGAKLACAAFISALLTSVNGASGADEQAQPKKAAKQFASDVKEMGKQVGRTAKKVGKDIGHGTARAARTVKREFKEDFVDKKDDDGKPEKQKTDRTGRK
jgi:hypothetical protein